MRVPLGWLADYVDVDLAPDQLADRLTLLGMEVRGIDRWGAEWRSVVVGELLAVEAHPRADRLSLATVTVGDGEPLRIVCGATNIAPGQRVPVALPGAVLPGERRIERTEKGGVVSEGMLCSGDELRLSADADGIFILAPDAPIGRPLSELLGDVVLDVDVKPNRGDALSLLGLAREVSAATGAPVRFPDITLAEAGPPVDERLSVEVRDPDLCSRFVARWVAGVEVGPSPELVQRRLLAAGMRPVSGVVDASNYVMLELGKPIHTFDAAAIHAPAGGRPTIVVRRAEPGERLETLDHVDRALDPDTLLIADPSGPLGIAGVMGGATSEISGATSDVVIESAVFDPVSIRRTGQRFALRSEASLRFEKGQEARLARIGADRAAQLVAEWAGGAVAPGRLDTTPIEPEPGRVAFRPARVARLLGTSLDAAEQRSLLARVGITTEPAGAAISVLVAGGAEPIVVDGDADTLVAVVPTWRRDLAIEADVAEEVARVCGYETVPAKRPDTEMPGYRASPLGIRDLVRDTLAGAGIDEVVTAALVAPDEAGRVRWPVDAADASVPGEERGHGPVIGVRNALAVQHSVLRQNLVGSLLDVLARNERQGRAGVAIFEVGKGYARTADATTEWWRLGLLLAGEVMAAAWNRAPRDWDLDDAKGLVALLAARLGHGRPSFTSDLSGHPFHPGRAALVVAPDARSSEPAIAGRVAELHPDLLADRGIRAERVVYAELAIAGLSGGVPTPHHVEPIPRVPPVERDVALVLPEATLAAAVEAAVRAGGGELLRDVRLFDVYRGAPLGADEKSLAYRLEFRDPERTLTEAEVDDAVAAIVASVAERTGGRIRA